MVKAALAALCALVLAQDAAAQAVGVLAAVNRDVIGERPKEQPRQLVLNERLISNERVTTTDAGGGQVLFLDQTSLTLSPNSDIVLDRYIYDPDKRAGELTVSVLKGAMRLVGGRITKTGVATIRTPSSTIGIRGGIGQVVVRDDGGATYMHIAGTSSTVTTPGGTVTVTREGGVVETRGESRRRARFAAAFGGGGGDEKDGGGGVGGDGGGGGGGGFAPVYLGLATRQIITERFSDGAGAGDGGSLRPVTRLRVRQRIRTVVATVSDADGATTDAPLSTTGERTGETFDPPPKLTGTPEDKIGDDNLAKDITNEIPQILDGVKVEGTWTALAGLANDGFVLPEAGLTFQMEYSLTDAQGLVAVELPDTGDLAGPNTSDLNGAPLTGDRFIVVGDEDLSITGDPSQTTELGGDATGAELTLSQSDVVSGSIFIDYSTSTLANTDFVDGEVTAATGTRVVGDDISSRVDAARE